MKRIGILGGSFNPIHTGHIHMARAAMTYLQLDQMVFMPNRQSPLKEECSVSFEDRFAMCELAIAEENNFLVSDLEKFLPIPSFTVDSIREFKRLQAETFGGEEVLYYFIIGDDQAMQLSKWKEIDTLASLVIFGVVNRETKEITCPYPHVIIPMGMHPASSTLIRSGDFRYLNPKVRDYILRHELYIKEFVASMLSPKRFKHTLSVRTLAIELASIHHLDCGKISLAAYLHDIAKEFSKEKLAHYMALETIEVQKTHPAIHHQFVGARYVEEMLQIEDQDILMAIRYHTTGDDNPYAKVLLVADKIEPLRHYDVREELVLVKKELNAGYDLVREKQKQFIGGK